MQSSITAAKAFFESLERDLALLGIDVCYVAAEAHRGADGTVNQVIRVGWDGPIDLARTLEGAGFVRSAEWRDPDPDRSDPGQCQHEIVKGGLRVVLTRRR